MNRIVIYDSATRFERITKIAARKLFEQGKPFYIIAHKMRPGMPFSMGMSIDPKRYQQDNLEHYTFEQLVTNFCWYNANCHETGTYAAFYLETPRSLVLKGGE